MEVMPASNMSMGTPSPSLTNPDMILPFDNPSSEKTSPTTTTGPTQLPSPPMTDGRPTRSGSNEHKSRVKHSGQSLSPFRNGVLSHTEGPTRIRSNSERGSGRIIYENSRLSYRPSGQVPVASSPTIPDELGNPSTDRLTESSEHEDLPIPSTYKTPSILDEDENDPDSHAAMTRRAEEILANAKRRLMNMEGNLNRARSTLGSRPSSSMSSFADHEPISSYSLQKERRAYGGFSPLKHRQASASLKEDHQGHSRVFSETSVPSSLQTTAPRERVGGDANSFDRNTEPSRNWFWNGISRSGSLADRHKNGLQSLNEDGPAPNSFERQAIHEEEEEENDNEDGRTPREDQFVQESAASNFDTQHPPTQGLTRARSTNQMRDLREQMLDLKGKISTLKQRAHEDNLRRRSLQSLRTPSPLNNAEHQDYSKVPLAEEQNRGAGIGLLPVSHPGAQAPPMVTGEKVDRPATAPEPTLPLEEGSRKASLDDDSGIDLHETIDHIHATNTELRSPAQPADQVENLSSDESIVEPQYQVLETEADDESKSPIKHGSDDLEITEEPSDVQDSLHDHQGYHEAVGERHEDRADAFDYEHFFLHSAMGHYGRKNRSSTHSSNYSTETERPPTMILGDSTIESEESTSRHERNNSLSSTSSAATFATATEGAIKEESGDEWTPRQTMAGTWVVDSPIVDVNSHKQEAFKPRPRKEGETKGERTAKRHRRELSIMENGVTGPATERSDFLVYLASLVSQQTGEQTKLLVLSDSDRELAERAIKSLAMVCSDLHDFSAGGGKYEARVCRRKLDTARRYLDGEVNGEAF